MKKCFALLLALTILLATTALARESAGANPALDNVYARMNFINGMTIQISGGDQLFTCMDDTNLDQGMVSFFTADGSIQAILTLDEEDVTSMMFACFDPDMLQTALNALCVASLWEENPAETQALAAWFDAHSGEMIQAVSNGQYYAQDFYDAQSFAAQLIGAPESEQTSGYTMAVLHISGDTAAES